MLKIDASYLSPNVNLAARLESATEQFEVSPPQPSTLSNPQHKTLNLET